MRLGDPRRVCDCCVTTIGPRVQIPQETIDRIRLEVGLHLRDGDSWRGPHQFIEYKLMRDHGKTVAIITGELHMMFIPDNAWAHWFEPFQGYIVWTRAGVRRARMIMRARDMWDRQLISADSYHCRMGICLGYTSEQVRRFVQK